LKTITLRRPRALGHEPAFGSPAPLSPAPAPSIPDHELIRCIGQGSYGAVWLAKSVMGTYRAVKIVRRGSFSDGCPFEREFAGLKRFEPISRTHPGFVGILHVGRNEGGGYFYCIMEVADDVASGQAIQPETYEPRTLGSDLARRARLPLSDCLEIGMCLAAALKDLHRHGLVHRDIKPSNIIFVNGAPKLADIGLVTAISEATTSLGTRGYAPPEDPGRPTADLYSLGKVLYQISTGKGPEHFPELPAERCDLGADAQFIRFNDVLLRACQSTAPKRYQSAEAFRAALSCCQRTAGTPASNEAPAGPKTGGASSPPAGSERKLLTVLMVNITRTDRADPEAAQSFMSACVDLIRPVLQRFGGMPAQVLSDGLMGIFGEPLACEDHARRGTQAALGVRQALEAQRQQLQTQYGLGFEVRLSLDTGLAIAGQTGLDLPPAGDLVDLAARMVHLADAGQIIMTEAACKAVKDYFVLRALGERRLPPRAAPLKIYQVDGSRELRTRLEAGLERGLTPFVGRSKELGLLSERLLEARQGRGQVVLLAGEPGVGKSRLLLEFQRSFGAGDACWLAGRSISYGSQMAYLPIIDLVKRLFQIEDTDDPTIVRARVDSEAQALGEEVRPALPLIKYLLSINTGGEKAPDMSAEQRRIRTFEALRNLVLKKAQRCPVILVIEDLHWVDRTSEEFLIWLADSLSMAPVLMLLTYRPEYRQRFPERSFVTHLTLQHLTDEESLEMASQVLTVTRLPDELRELVLTKAEGNPFFVEEMIKSLLETSALAHYAGNCEAVQTLSWTEVPDTIQDVILNRIDRLEESPRKALQLASVIGREFAVALLETIADLREPLAESLRKLKGLELIYERSVFPEHTCIFKHALTQEVAYNSLLLQHRKELHCLVAAAMEELYANRLPDFYGLLGYHYQRGEEWERALDYLQRAARRCREIGAYREEALQLGRAMGVAQRLGQAPVLAELRGQRGTAWVKCGKWAEAKPDLEAALEELPPENLGRRAELLSSLAAACFWALDIPGMQRHATEGHALAEKTGRDDLIAALLGWLGASQQTLGDLSSATELYERALAQGSGFCSAGLAGFPLTLYLRGRNAEALDRARESAENFRSLSDTFAATFGHPHLGLALAACGRYTEAASVFEEARQLGRKHEVWPFHARAIAMSAGFHLEVFDFEGNERLAEEAREEARLAGFPPSVVSASLDLVFNFTRRGEIGRAERLVEETAAAAATTGGWHQWLWQLRLRQARAELACARRDWAGALEAARAAISESRARGRTKYVVMGLETRARALAALGRQEEAIRDARNAVRLARAMRDPALFLRAAATLLTTDGDDALLAETRTTARKISAELPTDSMRRCFEAAEPVQLLGQL
jgi:serine/threonine protein kinase/tetratricopeptide (TPR) repeat protein